jgi:dihydrofolate reductase
MGRKTYISVGKPLVGRTNIVVSRDRTFTAPGVLVTSSLDRALEAARGDALRRGAAEIAVIGGADIYAQLMPVADRLLITRVHLQPDGDTKFPAIDPDVWQEVERTERGAGPDDEARFTLLVYERRTAGAGSTAGTR